ncbi:MAG: hypothetical protein VW125_05490 [Flavobacteriaceae bacterium]|jgi:hypothetical protein
MTLFKNFTPILALVGLITIFGCTKEEPLPDKSIGEWQVYSISDGSGAVTVWETIKADLVDLIPEYTCMEFTATVTEQIVSTKYVMIDKFSRGCLSPSISVYTWSIDPETGFYKYVQGTNVINYLISFSNGDNRMTWKDQTSGAVTIWDRVVEATAQSTE